MYEVEKKEIERKAIEILNNYFAALDKTRNTNSEEILSQGWVNRVVSSAEPIATIDMAKGRVTKAEKDRNNSKNLQRSKSGLSKKTKKIGSREEFQSLLGL